MQGDAILLLLHTAGPHNPTIHWSHHLDGLVVTVVVVVAAAAAAVPLLLHVFLIPESCTLEKMG